jgi:glycosyltransferase involved in cell wall biosynthesis
MCHKPWASQFRETDKTVHREAERKDQLLAAARKERDVVRQDLELVETQYADLLRLAQTLGSLAAQTERHPFRAVGRRIAYGAAQLLAQLPMIGPTSLGAKFREYSRDRTPSRHIRQVADLAAAHKSKRTPRWRQHKPPGPPASPLFGPLAIVVHDAHRNGAQMLALHLARFYARDLGIDVHIVLLRGGDLTSEFNRTAIVHEVGDGTSAAADGDAIARHLSAAGVRLAIVNSVASGGFVEPLRKAGIRTIALIHEMPHLIRDTGLEEDALAIVRHADKLVFPAEIVADAFAQVTPYPRSIAIIQPQGMYQPPTPRSEDQLKALRDAARIAWCAKPKDIVVIGAGYGDRRKGVDLFVETALSECLQRSDMRFVWLGRIDAQMSTGLRRRIAEAGLEERILLPGLVERPGDVMLGADIFLLSSREDPFPSVVLEAMDAGLPVVAIAGTGGGAELVAEGFGEVAQSEGLEDIRSALGNLMDKEARMAVAQTARHVVETRFSFRRYAYDLASEWGARGPRVSVVVPNFNYLPYLPERVASIMGQTWPVYELILLDDASNDGSTEWIMNSLPELAPFARVIMNDVNTGSPFVQWERGALETSGDLVWIAEADDVADPEFLERLAMLFEDEEVALAYSQSRAIGPQGDRLAVSYLDYTADLSPTKWRTDYVEPARTALATDFAVKNVIPNVSGVLFRRNRLIRALSNLSGEIDQWSVAGDWRIYAACLALGGKIAYRAEVLNSHRRHRNSASKLLSYEKHFREIEEMQRLVADISNPNAGTMERAKVYLETLRDKICK